MTEETSFIDQILCGWAHWSRSTGIDLRATQTGHLWQISTLIDEKDYHIQLTDDAFVSIDQAIAKLPHRLYTIVLTEYQDSRPSYLKARKLGLNRLAYRQRLHAAQWTLYAALTSTIDDWRQLSVQMQPDLDNSPQYLSCSPR